MEKRLQLTPVKMRQSNRQKGFSLNPLWTTQMDLTNRRQMKGWSRRSSQWSNSRFTWRLTSTLWHQNIARTSSSHARSYATRATKSEQELSQKDLQKQWLTWMTSVRQHTFSVLRTLLTLACNDGWIGLTGDISTAFLHAAAATADLYMYPPNNFYNPVRRTTSYGNCWKQSTDYGAVQKHGRNTWQKSFNRFDSPQHGWRLNPTSTWQKHASALSWPRSTTFSSWERNRPSTRSSRL